jgi:hypothetical protein
MSDVDRLIERLRELGTLEEGWYEKDTPAIDSGAVEKLIEYVQQYYNDPLCDRPLLKVYAYPIPDGNIQFEWERPHKRSEIELEIDLTTLTGLCAIYRYVHDGYLNITTVESELDLTSPVGWATLIRRLRELEDEQ